MTPTTFIIDEYFSPMSLTVSFFPFPYVNLARRCSLLC
jgi:hypothetical protein